MHKNGITLYEGKSKKDNTPYTALLLTVGKWSALYFPKSEFELEYIKSILEAQAQEQEQEQEQGNFLDD